MTQKNVLLPAYIVTGGLIVLLAVCALRSSAANALATLPVRSHVDQHTVVVKLKASENIDLIGSTFTGSDASKVDELNRSVASLHVNNKKRLINQTKAAFKQAKPQALDASTNLGNLDDYYVLHLSGSQTAAEAAAALRNLPAVETAFAKPLPAPAPATPSFISNQTYLNSAPTGMGVMAKVGGTSGTASYPGSTGSSVKVADLEYSWNTSHEDLSHLRTSGALWSNGIPADPFSNTDHGTAVAGILSADSNGLGVTGIVSGTNYHMVNTYSSDLGWDVAGAIYTAANHMSTGDVILIEQQAWAPDGTGYAPIEIYSDVFDAIHYATAKGITVVEPAGNGNPTTNKGYDLSMSQFGSQFSSTAPSSGALIVGAGGTGCSYVTASRMPYSNYGSRVDLQGPGECIVTAGYGDLYWTNSNTYYTGSFGGTSSASAMIAGVATELSSAYKRINGVGLLPAAIKADLISGGTPQVTSSNPGTIGVVPNMAIALQKTDITKPSTPSSITGSASTTHKITIKWGTSSDNLGFVRYRVYRNGSYYKTVSTPTYVDSVSAGKTYSYKVVAVDGSNNRSAATKTISITGR